MDWASENIDNLEFSQMEVNQYSNTAKQVDIVPAILMKHQIDDDVYGDRGDRGDVEFKESTHGRSSGGTTTYQSRSTESTDIYAGIVLPF